MWVRKFVARSLSEALAQVKAQLGPEAVILHTSRVKVGGLFGLFGTRMFEVTAAAERSETRLDASPAVAPQRPQTLQPPQPDPPVLTPVAEPTPATAAPDGLAAMKSEMASLKAVLGMVLERVGPVPSGTGRGAPVAEDPVAEDPVAVDPAAVDLERRLVGAGVEAEFADRLMDRLAVRMGAGPWNAAAARRELHLLMLEDLGPVRPAEAVAHGRRVVALVGPTGVGKTTTLAKLAAHFSLVLRTEVGLITADTYRIAAVDQLRVYSEILGVPLDVVYDTSELRQAIANQANRELILVDTAGRSPRNEAHMKELRDYLALLAPDEIHLVVSLTSSFREAAAVADSYLTLGAGRLVFTKWDEVEGPGLIYSMACKYRLPLSYITTGQNVPDDIEVANPEKIIRVLLGD